MARKILVAHGTVEKISKELGFSTKTVSIALKGLDETDNQKLIRKKALEFFGGVYAPSARI